MRTLDIEKKIRKNKLIQSFDVWKELIVFDKIDQKYKERSRENFLVHADDRTMNQILFYAGKVHRFDIIKELLKLGMNINLVNPDTDNNIIFEAVTTNNYSLLQFVQNFAPNIFSIDDSGDSAVSEVFSHHVSDKIFIRIWKNIFDCLKCEKDPYEILESILNDYQLINKDYNQNLTKQYLSKKINKKENIELITSLLLFHCSEKDIIDTKEFLSEYFKKNKIKSFQKDIYAAIITTLIQADNKGVQNIEYLLMPQNKIKFYYLEKKLKKLFKNHGSNFLGINLEAICQKYNNIEVQLYLNGNLDLFDQFSNLTNLAENAKVKKI